MAVTKYRLHRFRMWWIPGIGVPLLLMLSDSFLSFSTMALVALLLFIGVFTTNDLNWYGKVGLVRHVAFMGQGVVVLGRTPSSLIAHLTVGNRETFDGDNWEDLFWVCLRLHNGREVVLRQIGDRALALEYAAFVSEATGLALKGG